MTGWLPPNSGTGAAPEALAPDVPTPHVPTPESASAVAAVPPSPGVTVAAPRAPRGLPLRPLSTSEILDGTFATIRRHPAATLGLSAILVSIQAAITTAATVIGGQLPTDPFGTVAPEEASFHVGLSDLGGQLLAAIVGAVLTGMVVVVVAEDTLGRPVTIRGVWRRVRQRADGRVSAGRLGALLTAAVLAGALPFLGLLLLVVPGVLLWGGLALATPALILEQVGPFAALRRSWRLVRPGFGQVWGTRALSVVIGGILQLLLQVPFIVAAMVIAASASDATWAPWSVLTIIAAGEVVAGTVTAPFLAGVLALLYLDRRMRAEGLDIEWQRHLSQQRRNGR